MSVETLGTFSGVLLSLVFTYFPYLANWYEGLEGNYKALIYVGVLAVATGLIYFNSCYGFGLDFVPVTACGSAVDFINLFVNAVVGGAGTYITTKKLKVF